MSYEVLKRQLKEGNLSRIMHFYGEEAYLKNHYIDIVKKKLLGDFEEFNLIVFDGAAQGSDIESAVYTVPFVGEHKLIILKNTGLFKATGGNKELWKAVFSDDLPYLYLIACEDSFDKRSAVYKQFSGSCLSVEFKRRQRGDIKAWVTNQLTRAGKSIDAGAMELFLDSTGVCMYNVKAQTDRLISHAGHNKKISKEEVDAIVEKELFTKEYVYTDALFQKDKVKAATALSELLGMGNDPVMMIYIVSSAYMSAYKASLMIADGKSNQEIVKKLSLPMEFLAKKYIGFAEKMKASHLAKAVGRIKDADYKVKIGRTDPVSGIWTLTAELLINE